MWGVRNYCQLSGSIKNGYIYFGVLNGIIKIKKYKKYKMCFYLFIQNENWKKKITDSKEQERRKMFFSLFLSGFFFKIQIQNFQNDFFFFAGLITN